MKKQISFSILAGVMVLSIVGLNTADAIYLSPHRQLSYGVAFDEVKCNGDRVLVAITVTKIACLYESTAEKKSYKVLNAFEHVNPDSESLDLQASNGQNFEKRTVASPTNSTGDEPDLHLDQLENHEEFGLQISQGNGTTGNNTAGG